MNTLGSSHSPLQLFKGLLFSSFLLISVGTNAQIVNSIGLKSGATFSNQEWEYGRDFIDRDLNTLTGFNIAFITEMFSSKYFSLSTDLGYIQKGSMETWDIRDENNNGEITDVSFRYDFLYLAPQAKFKLPIQNFTPYALIGPRIDYFIHSQSNNEFGYLTFLADDVDYNEIIFGLNYGVGVQYDFEVFTVFLEGQYQQDISNFLNIEPDDNNIGVEVSNTAWLVNLGLAYKFGG